MTCRFTVNLPQNQKTVLRISPKLSLGEVRQILCEEKGYDPSRYVFLLPGKQKDVLDDSVTVGDLKSSEISFVLTSKYDKMSKMGYEFIPNIKFWAGPNKILSV